MVKKDKTFEELTPEDMKDIKIEFAPGCFDSFEGTQEELDAFIAEITNLIQTGEILESSELVDLEELLESDDPDDIQIVEDLMYNMSDGQVKRSLQ